MAVRLYFCTHDGSKAERPDKVRWRSPLLLPYVMLGSLFKQAQDKPVAGKERAREVDERPRSLLDFHGEQVSEQLPPTLRPPLERGVTTAVSTPHDAVLAELFPHRTGASVDRIEAVPEIPEIALGRDEAEGSGRPRSPSRNPLYDPFTGGFVGLSVQNDDGDQTHNDRTRFEAREDLWSHMTNIRNIQTQIANMHVGMENIGLGHEAMQLSVERMHSTAGSEGERWDDAVEGEEDEVKEKDVREQEFIRLADKFHGRREATESIMTMVSSVLQLYWCAHQVAGSSMNCRES